MHRFFRYTLLMCLIAFLNNANAQVSIATARAQSVGSTVTIRGVVTNGTEMGFNRYIQDGTAALTIYDNVYADSIKRWDSIEITGELSFWNNVLEIINVSSLIIIDSNIIKQPAIVTFSTGYDTLYENVLVQFNTVHFQDSTGSFSGGTEYTIDNDTITGSLYVQSTAAAIVGSPIPQGDIYIRGILTHYPFAAGQYQIQPRDMDDFGIIGPGFGTSLAQTNIDTASFTVGFTTLDSGTSVIYYGLTTGFEIDTIVNNNMDLTHSVNLTGLSPATIYYLKATTTDSAGDTSFSPIHAMSTKSLSTGNIKILFNKTIDSTVSTSGYPEVLLGAFDDTLIAYLDRAKYTVDIALYNFNSLNVVSAINDAYTRGVAVRLITDDGVSTTYNLLNLGGNKMKSPSGANYGLMHHKFFIFDVNGHPDSVFLLTGSVNFTGQNLSEANNIVIFQDQSIARGYLMEFEEMWAGNFGPDKTDDTPHEYLIGGIRVQNYFGPSDNTNEKIKDALGTADNEIHFAMYVFTRSDLANKILDMVSGGVNAWGIIEDSFASAYPYSLMKPVLDTQVVIFDPGYRLHHKYAIIDGQSPSMDPQVVTGSHNWSNAANNRNDENTVIIHNDTIANWYYQEWYQRYSEVQYKGSWTLIKTPNELSTRIIENVYPNPTGDFIFVDLGETGQETITLELVDLLGNRSLLYEGKVIEFKNRVKINLNAYPSGMYLLSARMNDEINFKRIMLIR
ncbi:MAG: T9SS type A sorting domain-containing protein [Bacteroidetes bacterium]|nr:T9SS type A sorting domain-containing protein [Bacteroidota bacterium]